MSLAFPTYEAPPPADRSPRIADVSGADGGARVLVVEDDASIRDLIALVVGSGGHRPLRAESVPRALELLDRARIDLVLTDLNMPGLGGLDLLAELSSRRTPPPVIVVSGSQDPAAIRAAKLLGARRVIEKPFSLRELRAAIDETLAPVHSFAAVA